MKFLETLTLALTPLSPIHIGCGEDFEPTNYVMDAGVLYGFDPSRAILPETLAKRLGELGDKADLLGIQTFFRANAQRFKAQASILIPVAAGLAKDYDKQVGQVANREANGNRVFNQLAIERAIHTGGFPYIPGSSLKGCLRTAWLDKLNQGRRIADPDERRNTSKLEKRLFGDGDFATSPMRLVKPSDLMPNQEPARRIMYAVNLKKERVLDREGNEREPKGPISRKECIEHAQYRAFGGTITLQDLLGETDGNSRKRITPSQELRLADLTRIIHATNAYHLPRLKEELRLLDQRGFVNPAWKKAIETLLTVEIEAQLQGGQAMLVRLGRYGTAESKTFSGEGVAQIKIMEGKGPDGKQKFSFQSHTKTVWLAAETSADRKHLLPFGWALLEINPRGDLPALRHWCEEESVKRTDMQSIRAHFAEERTKAEEEALQLKAEREAAQQAEQARLAAEKERETRRQAMSPRMKNIEDFIHECESRKTQLRGSKDKPNTTYHAKGIALARQFQEDTEATPEERRACADAIETWLPQIVTVDLKEMRKKLKLAALREPTACP